MVACLVGMSSILIANTTNPYLAGLDGMWPFFSFGVDQLLALAASCAAAYLISVIRFCMIRGLRNGMLLCLV